MSIIILAIRKSVRNSAILAAMFIIIGLFVGKDLSFMLSSIGNNILYIGIGGAILAISEAIGL